MKTTHTYLWEGIPLELWEKAQEEAKRRQMPMKWVLVRLLEDFVGELKPTRMPQKRRSKAQPTQTASESKKPSQESPVPVPAGKASRAAENIF